MVAPITQSLVSHHNVIRLSTSITPNDLFLVYIVTGFFAEQNNLFSEFIKTAHMLRHYLKFAYTSVAAVLEKYKHQKLAAHDWSVLGRLCEEFIVIVALSYFVHPNYTTSLRSRIFTMVEVKITKN